MPLSDDDLTYSQAIMCLVREAEDVAEDGTQPRLARRIEVFWRAWKDAQTGGDKMASQSDAALFTEMRQRLDKLEEMLQVLLDKVQQLAAGERDMMHEVYPPKDPEAA